MGAKRVFGAVAGLAVFLCGPSAIAADCNELLRLGYRNILETSGASDQRAAYSRDFCSEKYEYASSERKARISASYKVASGSAEASDAQIKSAQDKMCDFTKSDQTSASSFSVASQNIHQGALNAWQQCLKLQERSLQVEIDPTDDLRAVTVQMSWRRSSSIEFMGIDVTDAGTAECTATVPNAQTGEGVIKVGASTRFPITQDVAVFTCNRTFKKVGEIEGAKATRITFKTREGSFNVDLPAIHLTEIESREIRSIYDQVAGLRASSDGLSKALAALGEKVGKIGLQCKVYGGAGSAASCQLPGETLMSCTSGMNRGSYNFFPVGAAPTSCDTKQVGTDWTAAVCCRVAN